MVAKALTLSDGALQKSGATADLKRWHTHPARATDGHFFTADRGCERLAQGGKQPGPLTQNP
jgi:hypothetical protein